MLGKQTCQISEERSAEAAGLKFQLSSYEAIENYPIDKILDSAESYWRDLSYGTMKWAIV